MSEIKFQMIEEGKIIGEETCYEWHNGGVWKYCLYSDSEQIIHSGIYWPKGLNSLTRRQYTGLKDENGKEIYDGDVVNIEEGNFEVCFLEQCWYLRGVSPTSLSFGRLYETWNEARKKNLPYEVIGNIYENKELLKEKKQ